MEINLAHKGMKVYFGRSHGEKTLGEIVKCNEKKAKVKILEERGGGRGSEVGAVWNVPYSMMEPANTQDITQVYTLPKLDYNMFGSQVENLILEAIYAAHCDLTPENLSHDGELSATRINEKRATLLRQLKGLQAALGREVTEAQIDEWHNDKLQKLAHCR